MKLLICLRVKHGFPVDALLGFLGKSEREIWDLFLADFYFDVCICPDDGRLFLLNRDCPDEQMVNSRLIQLPLIKEGFLEIQAYQFGQFKSVDNLFSVKPYADIHKQTPNQ